MKAAILSTASMIALAFAQPAAAQSTPPPPAPAGGSESPQLNQPISNTDPTTPTVDQSAPADPQDDAAPKGADIVVTGTRLGLDGYRAPTPVTVVGLAEIRNQAPKDLTDFVTQIPSIVGSMTPATRSIQASNGTAGISSPALRGLGSHRTLVLLDGRRSVPATQTGEVDIETFPQQLVNRIDVVTGGASAAYGSDALAGVINFVLDKDFTGLKGEMSGGLTGYGDDRNYKFALSGGTKFAGDRGHLLLSAEHAHTGGVFGNSNGAPPTRDWQYGGAGVLQNPAYTATNGQPFYIAADNYALANATKGGIITSGPLRGTAFDLTGNPYQFQYGLVGVGGSFMSGGDWQRSDITGAQILVPRQTRTNVFGRASFDVTDHFNVFAEASYSDSKTRGGGSTTINQGNLTIRTDNAFLPASVRAQAQALGVTSFLLGRIQTGGRFGAEVERKVQRYVIGASGDFDAIGSNWDWNAYYQHGVTRSFDQAVNNYRRANYLLAIDSVVGPSGAIVCRSTLTAPTNGCVPLNPFGFSPGSAESRAYVYGNSSRLQYYTEDVASAEIRGKPFSTWAGPVAVAIGGEYRREGGHGTVDPLSAANGWNAANFVALNGNYSVKEGFAEISVPLLNEMSFTKSLDLSAAVRATDYSVAGYVTTWKGGLTWAPIDDIRFRFTRSRDIRAPNLAELFTRGLNQVVGVQDPQNGRQTIQATQVTTGNLNLRPERADTLGIGIILQPRFLKGFNFSVDYYDIRVNGAIGTVAAQDIVDQCFAGVTTFCPAITRAPVNGVNVITQVANQPFNFASQHASGIDFDLTQRIQLDDIFTDAQGRITVRAIVTKFLKNVLDNGITPAVDIVGEMRARQDTPSLGSIPRWKAVGIVTYDRDPFTLSMTARGVSSGINNATYIECTSNCPAFTANAPTIDNNHVDGAWYFDASFTFRPNLPAKPEFFFSVKNIGDKDPAIVARGPGGQSYGFRATQESIYDILGRTFQFGMRFRL